MHIPATVLDKVWQRVQREGRISQHLFPNGQGPGIDLWGSIGSGYVLDENGEIFEWNDVLEGLRRVDDHGANRALSLSKKRFPELAAALPVRPPDARECAKCEGHGFVDFGEHRRFLLCDVCDGLGWSAA